MTDTDELYVQLERSIGFPIGAIQFVMNAVNFALNDSSLTEDGHTSAQGVCRCFLEVVIDSFGSDAVPVLKDWKVGRSEDVGKSVVGLIEAGLIGTSDGDEVADFDGLFDLDRDQSEWVLKW